MILEMISLVKVKLSKFPESIVKPAIINQYVVENHFCQLRAANGQNENPTYLFSIIFGQRTVGKKCNTGTLENSSFTELPKENCSPQKTNVKIRSLQFV